MELAQHLYYLVFGNTISDKFLIIQIMCYCMVKFNCYVLAASGAIFRLPHPSVNHGEMAREATRISAATGSQPQIMMVPGLRNPGSKEDGIVTRSRSRLMRK